jgi:hypothetical protein
MAAVARQREQRAEVQVMGKHNVSVLVRHAITARSLREGRRLSTNARPTNRARRKRQPKLERD